MANLNSKLKTIRESYKTIIEKSLNRTMNHFLKMDKYKGVNTGFRMMF